AFFPTINGRERLFANRPDVVGVFRGSGGGRSALFSTHIDTVPAGTGWSAGTPFGGEIVDGKLYGRGSYDTKCALASHLFAVRCLREVGAELRGDVLVESVVDEEYGGSHGVLAARLRGYHADIAINSEPTHLQVCPAHRGGREAYLRFQGDAGMAYAGEKQVDPILALARAVVAIKDFDRARNQAAKVPDLYRDEPNLPFYLDQIGGGGTTYEEAVGTPAETYLHFWAETFEGTTGEEFDRALTDRIAQELDGHADTAGQRPRLVPTIRYLPGSSMPLGHPALGMLREAYEGLAGRPFRLRGAPFACDAYVFNLYSPTPALILGPGGGGAHAADEYVLTADLIDLAKICARFIWRWCR
ncbi:MAG TPA: M20/M25/M40 family metallo-hydrolase, partial [Chloroflexota bacterium]|nr:M20/M25/M40 family metallo-hydrolase [Chloroflexota bacterium]